MEISHLIKSDTILEEGFWICADSEETAEIPRMKYYLI